MSRFPFNMHIASKLPFMALSFGVLAAGGPAIIKESDGLAKRTGVKSRYTGSPDEVEKRMNLESDNLQSPNELAKRITEVYFYGASPDELEKRMNPSSIASGVQMR